MNDTTSVVSYLVGDLGLQKFIAAFVFSLIGIALSLLWASNKSAAKSDAFHLTFVAVWNRYISRFLKAAASAVLTVFITIRFMKELLGVEFSMVYALLVGLFLDRIIAIIKKKSETMLPKTD